MAKKRVMKVPKRVMIKCPHCSAEKRADVSADNGINFLDCGKCKHRIQTPITKCCIVCAFSDKKCPYSLMIEARAKGLAIKS